MDVTFPSSVAEIVESKTNNGNVLAEEGRKEDEKGSGGEK